MNVLPNRVLERFSSTETCSINFMGNSRAFNHWHMTCCEGETKQLNYDNNLTLLGPSYRVFRQKGGKNQMSPKLNHSFMHWCFIHSRQCLSIIMNGGDIIYMEKPAKKVSTITLQYTHPMKN